MRTSPAISLASFAHSVTSRDSTAVGATQVDGDALQRVAENGTCWNQHRVLPPPPWMKMTGKPLPWLCSRVHKHCCMVSMPFPMYAEVFRRRSTTYGRMIRER